MNRYLATALPLLAAVAMSSCDVVEVGACYWECSYSGSTIPDQVTVSCDSATTSDECEAMANEECQATAYSAELGRWKFEDGCVSCNGECAPEWAKD